MPSRISEPFVPLIFVFAPIEISIVLEAVPPPMAISEEPSILETAALPEISILPVPVGSEEASPIRGVLEVPNLVSLPIFTWALSVMVMVPFIGALAGL